MVSTKFLSFTNGRAEALKSSRNALGEFVSSNCGLLSRNYLTQLPFDLIDERFGA
jgi:hypothetical protein